MINNFEYDYKQGVELIEKFLLPKGYQRSDNFERSPSWFKLYDPSECAEFLWVSAVIDIDLTAFVQPACDCDGLFIKSFRPDLATEDSEFDEYIELMKQAKEDVEKDLNELYKYLEEILVEKIPDNIYTVTSVWQDFGQFDEDGIPGVDQYSEEQVNSLEKAVKKFFQYISFKDDDVSIYRGNKEITNEILSNEEMFKLFYNDKEALKESSFNDMTYEEAKEKLKELTEYIEN